MRSATGLTAPLRSCCVMPIALSFWGGTFTVRERPAEPHTCRADTEASSGAKPVRRVPHPKSASPPTHPGRSRFRPGRPSLRHVSHASPPRSVIRKHRMPAPRPRAVAQACPVSAGERCSTRTATAPPSPSRSRDPRGLENDEKPVSHMTQPVIRERISDDLANVPFMVSEGGLEPPRPIKGTSTSS